MEEFWEREETTPERKLWLSVLLLLVRDCQLDYNHYRNSTNGKSKKLWEKVLANKNEVNSIWVEQICEMAEISYTRLKTLCLDISEGRKDLELSETGRWY